MDYRLIWSSFRSTIKHRAEPALTDTWGRGGPVGLEAGLWSWAEQGALLAWTGVVSMIQPQSSDQKEAGGLTLLPLIPT